MAPTTASLPAENEARFWESVAYVTRFFMGQANVQGALEQLVDRLESLGIPYAVVGALALGELGYRRAKAIGRFLSGGDGDLVELARRLMPGRTDRISAEILSVDPARFIYASRGYHSPVAGGRLWEDLEKQDRVEMVFLSEFVEPAEAK